MDDEQQRREVTERIAKEIVEAYTAATDFTEYVVTYINKNETSPAAVAFMLNIVADLYARQMPKDQWTDCLKMITESFTSMKEVGLFHHDRPADHKLN